MGGKSNYLRVVLMLLAAFCLFCVTWFAARYSAPVPYRVNTAQRLPETEDETPSEEDSYPESLLPGEVINVNEADFYDLQRLPGIGEKRARDIISYREEHGPFKTADELTQISGIGPGILEGLREYITTGNE